MGIYLNPASKQSTPTTCRSIAVSAFFRELILLLRKDITPDDEQPPTVNRLIEVLYDQIWLDKVTALEIPIPTDRRLEPIVSALLNNANTELTLNDWAKQVGASARTLSRLFKKEVGLSFPQWRQRLRLLKSLSLLEKNETIQAVAHDVGYQSVSSFIDAFKQQFKFTPQQYKKNNHQLDFHFSKVSE